MAKAKVAILISGRGSNMAALVEAAKSPDYSAEIVGVLSNKSDAAGLGFARSNGIATAVVSLKDFSTKLEADQAITRQLESWGADILCLAGFMRILTPEFCAHWQGKAINIHPSLLPKYKGLDTHARAIEAGDVEHGCTVHFVTAGMDEGPVIGQARVPIEPGDTPDSLAARVLVAEHQLYPEALAKLASGTVSFD